MVVTITDPVLLAQLKALREPTPLVQPDAQFIGTFIPAACLPGTSEGTDPADQGGK